MKSEHSSVTDNSEITSIFLAPVFTEVQTQLIYGIPGWNLTYRASARKLDRSISINISKAIIHNHRSFLTATISISEQCLISFTVSIVSLIDLTIIMCLSCFQKDHQSNIQLKYLKTFKGRYCSFQVIFYSVCHS